MEEASRVICEHLVRFSVGLGSGVRGFRRAVAIAPQERVKHQTEEVADER